MQIRPITREDIARVDDIDGIVESTEYLHVISTGEGLLRSWQVEKRPLREKKIEPNRLDDEARFIIRQIATETEEGFGIVADHDDALAGILIATLDPVAGLLTLREVRIDYDLRRQGLATAMVFQAIQHAREKELRAVSARTITSNVPGCELMLKCGFELTGLDTHALSNHDLVKEAVTLQWYAPLD